jgi:hypothetical protein
MLAHQRRQNFESGWPLLDDLGVMIARVVEKPMDQRRRRVDRLETSGFEVHVKAL